MNLLGKLYNFILQFVYILYIPGGEGGGLGFGYVKCGVLSG